MRNQVHRGRYRRKAVDGGGTRRLEGSRPAEVGQPQDIQARSGSPPKQFVLLSTNNFEDRNMYRNILFLFIWIIFAPVKRETQLIK